MYFHPGIFIRLDFPTNSISLYWYHLIMACCQYCCVNNSNMCHRVKITTSGCGVYVLYRSMAINLRKLYCDYFVSELCMWTIFMRNDITVITLYFGIKPNALKLWCDALYDHCVAIMPFCVWFTNKIVVPK